MLNRRDWERTEVQPDDDQDDNWRRRHCEAGALVGTEGTKLDVETEKCKEQARVPAGEVRVANGAGIHFRLAVLHERRHAQ
jgi:hypothetical protein